ncbi:uncharacterized protein FFC1_04574 [Fusarium fujikuroi]|nr:uncharacterized protein FFC1_04574 [Fusarium fujikuroi]
MHVVACADLRKDLTSKISLVFSNHNQDHTQLFSSLRCGLDYSIRFTVNAFSKSAVVDGVASCLAAPWMTNLSSDKL